MLGRQTSRRGSANEIKLPENRMAMVTNMKKLLASWQSSSVLGFFFYPPLFLSL